LWNKIITIVIFLGADRATKRDFLNTRQEDEKEVSCGRVRDAAERGTQQSARALRGGEAHSARAAHHRAPEGTGFC